MSKIRFDIGAEEYGNKGKWERITAFSFIIAFMYVLTRMVARIMKQCVEEQNCGEAGITNSTQRAVQLAVSFHSSGRT
jgi:hypothetical protein